MSHPVGTKASGRRRNRGRGGHRLFPPLVSDSWSRKRFPTERSGSNDHLPVQKTENDTSSLCFQLTIHQAADLIPCVTDTCVSSSQNSVPLLRGQAAQLPGGSHPPALSTQAVRVRSASLSASSIVSWPIHTFHPLAQGLVQERGHNPVRQGQMHPEDLCHSY